MKGILEMKKVVEILLCLILALGIFTGCTKNTTQLTDDELIAMVKQSYPNSNSNKTIEQYVSELKENSTDAYFDSWGVDREDGYVYVLYAADFNGQSKNIYISWNLLYKNGDKNTLPTGVNEYPQCYIDHELATFEDIINLLE